ncbi:MAG: DUF29 domain-containing protein [Candidatus Tectomicrobia bacterium]|uniref:DUF29 domain-containing protein n=1 Tax=Tectimicrobiota bacterium TaxID=2528274 RepID=A0A937W392_UNCTE|nr:DUF29 domain-containing protein [Candidatus Tectomicrobia bacterium]
MPPHVMLYEQDFYAWTQAQATLLEARQWESLDLPHLVEEISTLGASERRALGSHLKQLVMHLLKWRYQPEGRLTSHSWRASIRHARDEIAQVLEESPSLQRTVPTLLARRYPAARLLAHDETGLPLATFPETCPWTVMQILTDDFWPDA